ncbi:MAG: exopolyphosphatase, partial [Lachnospiraceae bacterium]|nr:exopolyphosphatase [Lachnospiraceae bacterium]
MAARLFGAIDVGSYELELKIFEISKKNGVRTIDDIVRRLDLGTDTYNYGKLSFRRTEELKKVMLEFKRIMDNYGVEAYKAYGTSAIRELTGASIILDQIENETGIHVEILGNAEQRFLDYKSIAFRSGTFEKMIGTGTAILDIGSG